jgi:hypothetical protein
MALGEHEHMPRSEQPIGAEDTEVGQFAAGLRKLREKAGSPTYRELGARAHYSAAALSVAANGKKLPSFAVTMAYVRACGGAIAEWEQRWRSIAAPPTPVDDSPYVGPAAFQAEDAERFFGREALTAKLLTLTTERPFVGVFGASGSGKSSLLRAGLASRLSNAVVFTPGSRRWSNARSSFRATSHPWCCGTSSVPIPRIWRCARTT